MRTKVIFLALAAIVVLTGLYVGYGQQAPPPAAYEYFQRNAYLDEAGERHVTSEQHVYLYEDGTKVIDGTLFKPRWGANLRSRQWILPDGTIRTEFPLVGRVITFQNTPEQTKRHNNGLREWTDCVSPTPNARSVGSDTILGYKVDVFEIPYPNDTLRLHHAPELGCEVLLQQTFRGGRLVNEKAVVWVRKGNPATPSPAINASAVESKPSAVVDAFRREHGIGCDDCEQRGLDRYDKRYQEMQKPTE